MNLKLTHFEIGDKVICIDDDNQISNKFCEGVTKGTIYTVSESNDSAGTIRLKEVYGRFNNKRFDRAENKMKTLKELFVENGSKFPFNVEGKDVFHKVTLVAKTPLGEYIGWNIEGCRPLVIHELSKDYVLYVKPEKTATVTKSRLAKVWDTKIALRPSSTSEHFKILIEALGLGEEDEV